jgi:hypothetical protein
VSEFLDLHAVAESSFLVSTVLPFNIVLVNIQRCKGLSGLDMALWLCLVVHTINLVRDMIQSNQMQAAGITRWIWSARIFFGNNKFDSSGFLLAF